jgi:hypothetical protein
MPFKGNHHFKIISIHQGEFMKPHGVQGVGC